MKRHEVINRMWNAAKECIEACNADGKCALTFFALLEKCKSKVPRNCSVSRHPRLQLRRGIVLLSFKRMVDAI